MLKKVYLSAVFAALVVAASPPAAYAAPTGGVGHAVKESPTGVYIAIMDLDPAIAYDGDVKGYVATKPGKGQKINPNSAHVKKYTSLLQQTQDKALSQVGAGAQSASVKATMAPVALATPRFRAAACP